MKLCFHRLIKHLSLIEKNINIIFQSINKIPIVDWHVAMSDNEWEKCSTKIKWGWSAGKMPVTKTEGVSLDPQHPQVAGCICNPVAQVAETGGSLEFIMQPL